MPESVASDRDARFAEEALPWMDDVYRFAVSLSRNEADAQDIVQETYLRAYRSWHTFVPGSDCRRWLIAICRNVFLRSREKASREVDVEGELDSLAAAREMAEATGHGGSGMLDRLDLPAALQNALDSLEEPFRSTVLLVDVEQYSYQEAAEMLDVPVGTVRSRLYRGRRMLQTELLAFARDAGFKSVETEGRTHEQH